MKNSLFIIFYFVFQICYGAGTCPSPTCTYTAISGTSYTVNAGETICVNVNYSSGTITLNGGTLLIQTGGTVDRARLAFTTKTITAATIASPIVVTSTAHGYSTGQTIGIAGSTTIVGLDGVHTITVIDANSYSLDGSTGSGTFGGTIRSAYVNTISTCGSLTGSGGPLVTNAYTIYNNYADNALTFSTNTSSTYRGGEYGTINNYGSPSSITLTWSKALNINNMSGGVMTISNTSISGSSVIYNYSSVANSLTFSASALAINSGTSTRHTQFYNQSGATTAFSGTVDLNSYVDFTNDGTVTFADNFTIQSATSPVVSNSGTFTMATSKAISINSGNFANTGTVTTTEFTTQSAGTISNSGTITTTNYTINGTSGINTFNSGSVMRVTGTYTNFLANSIAFGTGTTCAYLNVTGGTATTSQNITNAAANKIYYCGPSPSNPGTINNLGTSCTAPSCSVSLPIDLISFDTKVKTSSVEFKWVVASQVNNNYFSIERSTDGLNFESVGIVKGAGTTNQLMNYFFEDNNPLSNTSYYRLKQTDFDGKSESFEIKQVSFNSTINSCSIYPNPSEGELVYLKFDNIQNHLINNVRVTVYDMSGDLIYDFKIDENFEKPILLSNNDYKLPKGIYLVKVHHDNDVDFLRLIIH